ncbi:MAG: hypothetical protein GX748_19780 [Lentisphaerae bacterium]|nr:hypothetical protein [Lentisphaerota bacterium]
MGRWNADELFASGAKGVRAATVRRAHSSVAAFATVNAGDGNAVGQVSGRQPM